MAYLRISNLKKSYRVSRTEKQQVLRGINVEFKRGEFVAVLGESGCGKSTFMNILGGLDQDYTGSIVLDGEFLKDYSEKKLDDYRKSRVGLIFQNYNLISHMSVKENIEVAMTMSNINREERKARTQDVLAQVGLSEYADKLPNQLSGGQRQRVAIARALANNPEVLLMDEPFGALDAHTRVLLQRELLKIWEQDRKTVVFVTHSVDEALYLADRIVVMTAHPGRVLEEIEVPFERPRSRATKGYGEMAERILELLEQNEK